MCSGSLRSLSSVSLVQCFLSRTPEGWLRHHHTWGGNHLSPSLGMDTTLSSLAQPIQEGLFQALSSDPGWGGTPSLELGSRSQEYLATWLRQGHATASLSLGCWARRPGPGAKAAGNPSLPAPWAGSWPAPGPGCTPACVRLPFLSGYRVRCGSELGRRSPCSQGLRPPRWRLQPWLCPALFLPRPNSHSMCLEQMYVMQSA